MIWGPLSAVVNRQGLASLKQPPVAQLGPLDEMGRMALAVTWEWPCR